MRRTGVRRRAWLLAAVCVAGGCSTASRADTGSEPVVTVEAPVIGLTPRVLDPGAPTSQVPSETTAPATTTNPPRDEPSSVDPSATGPRPTLAPLGPGTTLQDAIPLPATSAPANVPVPTNPLPMAPISIPYVADPVVHPDTLMAGSTACTTVFHIGDSLTVGTMNNVPAPQRQDAQYARVGVTYPRVDALGGRTIHEFRIGVTTAVEAASRIREQSGHGCWVFAIGTNDAANISIGSDVKQQERIDRMMEIAGGDPVLWVNTITITDRGAWAGVNMQLWNEALLDATSRYPNMRIFDIASEVHDDEFLTDGIHYTGAGYARRARMIADALATAFPA